MSVGTRGRQQLFALASSGLLLVLTGCSRFSIADAAQRIAFTQGCDEVDLSLVEGYRAGYEALECGERRTYQCADGQCRAVPEARPNPVTTRRIEAAHAGLAAVEDEISNCVSGNLPLTVRVRFNENGHVSPPLVGRPQLDGSTRGCVGSALLSVRIAPGDGEMMVSHTYGAAQADSDETAGTAG